MTNLECILLSALIVLFFAYIVSLIKYNKIKNICISLIAQNSKFLKSLLLLNFKDIDNDPFENL